MRGLLPVALALLALAPALGSPASTIPPTWQASAATSASVIVEGSPSSDEHVDVTVRAGDLDPTIRWRRTPAQELGVLPGSGAVRNNSPVGPAEARMLVQAGPVVLERPGRLSSSFETRIQVLVDASDGIDRAWLHADGSVVGELEQRGARDGAVVFAGSIPPEWLPEEGLVEVGAVLERRPAEGFAQRVDGPAWELRTDSQGPPAPRLRLVDDAVQVDGPGTRFEGQVRTSSGDWRPAAVHQGVLELPQDGYGEQAWARARGVDDVGNPGPWSTPLEIENRSETQTRPRLPWTLVAPRDGQRLDGEVEIRWSPSTASPRVEAAWRTSPQGNWTTVGHASRSPIVWQTGFVPDGRHELRVRAFVDGNWTTEVLEVSVDNLDETSLEPGAGSRDRGPGSRLVGSGSPWAGGLVSIAAVVALGAALGRAGTGRPK